MSKVRINDLARELEVKSKAILDTLPLVGVTEKKTHSSSLEEHEAEKVRVYIRSSAEGSSSSGKSSARGARGEEEIKTKIDLSNISRPGDVLKAITQRKEAAVPPAAARPLVPPPSHVPAEKPAVSPLAGVSRPATVAPPPVKPVTAPPAGPVSAAPTASPAPARPVAAPPAPTAPVVASPVRPVAPPPAAPVPPAVSSPSVSASAPPAAPAATARPAAPPPPAPRMIVPQTGPRPVYKAPLRPAPPAVQPGVPID